MGMFGICGSHDDSIQGEDGDYYPSTDITDANGNHIKVRYYLDESGRKYYIDEYNRKVIVK